MGNGKLQYEKEILGNNRDDRYEERGNMPYKELYLDNLPNRSKEIIISNVKMKQSLYSIDYIIIFGFFIYYFINLIYFWIYS